MQFIENLRDGNLFEWALVVAFVIFAVAVFLSGRTVHVHTRGANDDS